MELFREKLKVQNLAIAMCSFILAAFSFLSAAGEAGIIHFMTQPPVTATGRACGGALSWVHPRAS